MEEEKAKGLSLTKIKMPDLKIWLLVLTIFVAIIVICFSAKYIIEAINKQKKDPDTKDSDTKDSDTKNPVIPDSDTPAADTPAAEAMRARRMLRNNY
jgi:hypothetical protein